MLKAMVDADGKILLVPLSNVFRLKRVKHGAHLTIAVPGEVMDGIVEGRYVGGLVLADRKEFVAIKRKIEDGS